MLLISMEESTSFLGITGGLLRRRQRQGIPAAFYTSVLVILFFCENERNILIKILTKECKICARRFVHYAETFLPDFIFGQRTELRLLRWGAPHFLHWRASGQSFCTLAQMAKGLFVALSQKNDARERGNRKPRCLWLILTIPFSEFWSGFTMDFAKMTRFTSGKKMV